MEYLLAAIALPLGALLGYSWARAGRERLRAERDGLARQLTDGQAAHKQQEDAFGNLARQVLAESTEALLARASEKLGAAHHAGASELEQRKQAIEALLKPLNENLQRLGAQAQEMENARHQAYGGLMAEVRSLGEATRGLQGAHQALATALRGSSQARGRWGEVSLRRIAELAGMSEHIDFVEQELTADGNRPDMVVNLPGGGAIPVDAKVPLAGYLDAVAATDPAEQQRHLQRHANDLWTHVLNLARRDYTATLGGRIDFTVLFLPGDAYLAAAFQQQPDLQEQALDRRILIATPVTLLALLRTVNVYWRQETVARNAAEVWEAAKEYHKRTVVFQRHLTEVGRGLERAVDSYDRAVASLQARVLPAGRKLEELQATESGTALEDPASLNRRPRALAEAEREDEDAA